MRKALSLILTICLLSALTFSLASCGGGGDGTEDGEWTDPSIYVEYNGEVVPLIQGAHLKPTDGCDFTDMESYTYRASVDVGDGITLNPFSASTALDEYLLSLICSPLYSAELDEEMKLRFDCELAAKLPEDVTSEYYGRYGITEGESARAFRITLSHGASINRREITAEDFIYSFRAFLDPLVRYGSAAELCYGELAIVGAEEYYEGAGSWEDVGIIATDEFSFDIITAKSIDNAEVIIPHSLTKPLLVDRELYEKSIVYIDGQGNVLDGHGVGAVRAKSTYGLDSDFRVSYGPYRISEYVDEKLMRLERNSSWYSAAKAGVYQTDAVELTLDGNAATDEFLSGEYEIAALKNAELVDYANSGRLASSARDKYSILTFRTGGYDGTGEAVSPLLSVKDMRLAIAAALDTAAEEMAEPLSPEVFGREQSGVSYVRGLLSRAYTTATEAGIYSGEPVTLTLTLYGTDTEIVKLLPSVIERAALYTPFEGLISLEICVADTELPHGDRSIALVTVSRSELLSFLNSDIPLSGYKTEEQNVTLSFDGESFSAPLSEWLEWMCGEGSIAELGARDGLAPEVRYGFDRAIITAYTYTLGDCFAFTHTSTYIVSMRLVGDAVKLIGEAGLHNLKYLTYRYNDEQWKKIAQTISYK